MTQRLAVCQFKQLRMLACSGEVINNQNAFEQADRVAYIYSLASLSNNCRVIQKTIVTESPHRE